MKKTAFLLVILLFSLFGFNPLGKIRYNEPVNSGKELEMHVNVVSNIDKDMYDVKVRMFIPELDIMISGNPFNLDDKEKTGKFLFWDTDDIPKGTYLARITVSNDEFKDVKYRYITII